MSMFAAPLEDGALAAAAAWKPKEGGMRDLVKKKAGPKSEQNIKQIFDKVDRDRDGKITKQQFYELLPTNMWFLRVLAGREQRVRALCCLPASILCYRPPLQPSTALCTARLLLRKPAF